MKYIKVMFPLGLIALGIFLGNYISPGEGNAALLGGLLAFILYCLIYWSGSRWFGSRGKDGFSPGSKEAIDNTAGLSSAQESLMQEQDHMKLGPW